MKFSSAEYLVTGAAGFIGSRFVEFCNSQGISIISVDQEDYFRTRPHISGLQFGQIVDRKVLIQRLKEEHPPLRAIVHLGAITDTRETNLERLRSLNLEYSQSLWNYATENRISMVYASSAATYGNGILGYDDDESLISSLKPLNAYGDSKQSFDLWVLHQEKNGYAPPSWSGFKFFNVFGFGEHHKGFMSSVVLHAFDQIQQTGKVTLFKSHRNAIPDGHQKRDFIYVDDVIRTLQFAIQKPIPRGIYNLGTGKARTFLDLAQSVFRSLHKVEQFQFIDTPPFLRDQYQYFTQAQMNKLRHQGFDQNFTSLEEGVQHYVQRLLKHS